MNDSDIEALAFTEKKVAEMRDEIVTYSKSMLRLGAGAIASETFDLNQSVRIAIDKIRPADGRFTLGQIAAMRKILDKTRDEMILTTGEIEHRFELLGTYIEIYIAKGVSPKELDIGGKDIKEWFVPLIAAFDRLTSRIASVHPLAYGVLEGIDFDVNRRIAVVCRAEQLLKRSAANLKACIVSLSEQDTRLMSGDGLDERQRIIGELCDFHRSLQLFMGIP